MSLLLLMRLKGEAAAQTYINSLSGKVAYWPMQDTALANVIAYDDSGLASTLDGTNDASVVVAQNATGSLGLAFSYNGTTSQTNLDTPALVAAFPSTDGGISIYCQNNDWDAVGTERLIIYEIDANNRIYLISTTQNIILTAETQGDTQQVSTVGLGLGATDWINVIVNWVQNGANTDWELFVNNVSAGTTSTVGTLTGAIATAMLGKLPGEAQISWNGGMDHKTLLNRPFTSGERTALAALI